MSAPKVGPITPKVLTETVYLHLKPTTPQWNNTIDGVSVRKIAKSVDASVEPGDYIVRLEVSVPSTFFAEAMPSARIEVEPGKVVAVMVEQADEPEDDEA